MEANDSVDKELEELKARLNEKPVAELPPAKTVKG